MTLMLQTPTFPACFACILATLHQQIPKETLCLEEPERVCRHVICQGFLHQHLCALLYVLGDFATGTHRNADSAMGFRFRSPREILCVLVGLYLEPTEILICYFAMGIRCTAKPHVDAVINKIFMMMLLSSGHAQNTVSPSRRSIDATLVDTRMSR